ncbi:hypothetical protein KDM41_14960 [bacterium]|nr:hypothetical protein [bacterium]
MRIRPLFPVMGSALSYTALGVASAIATNPLGSPGLQAAARLGFLAAGGLVLVVWPLVTGVAGGILAAAAVRIAALCPRRRT